MSWGAHGAMGELKSPLGMMAGHCLVPCDLGSLGLGGALLLASLYTLFLFVRVRSRPFCSFALAAWVVSRMLAVAFGSLA